MNRNVESHFSSVPYVDKPRSIFDRSFGHKTSFNAGELIPFYLEQNVLPGDTFRVTTSKVVRMQTLLTPIMDNMYLDTYYFFVPWRLVWTHVREFFGENTTSAWVQTTPYKIPGIAAPSGGFATGTLADYFGLPVGVSWSTTDKACPSALPFRAYALICNEFFRDQNLSDPLNIPTGDSDQTGTNGSSYINDVANGGKPFKVAKFHDYFTSCLPSPQKAAEPVSLQLVSDYIPVYPRESLIPLSTYKDKLSYSGLVTNGTADFAYGSATDWPSGSGANIYGKFHRGSNSPYPAVITGTNTPANAAVSYNDKTIYSADTAYVPLNLWAQAKDYAGVTVNELRLAFQLQRYYEALARGGSRYIEWCKTFFGAVSSDARLQRPEYLGGNRIPININQVINSAQSTNDYLGDLGAMSVTADIHDDFVKSFTEHGIIIGVMCVRYDHTYSQGINRAWTRRTLEDQYVPTWAMLGEMPVYKYQIYADGNMNNDAVFGYQEAWADYRYFPDICSGEMRPGIANTLASWHLGDYYAASPTLSDSWIREDLAMVDRVLAVQSANANQFWADIRVKNIATRVLPMYSIPGLIDHF